MINTKLEHDYVAAANDAEIVPTLFVEDVRRAIREKRYRLIAGRDGRSLYLARFWLHQPHRLPDGDFDSGDSVLLHHFLRPDSDAALHDHPWDFSTTIIRGAYTEAVPPPHWYDNRDSGPDHDSEFIKYGIGSTIHHFAKDLHAVAWIAPQTWTLVRTGPRRREWGFHPPGRAWTHWRTYLGLSPLPGDPHGN